MPRQNRPWGLTIITGLLLVATLSVPAAAQVSPDEVVLFHGPYLFWDADGKLTLVLRGRFFEPENRSAVRRAAIDRVIAPALFRYMAKKPADFDDAARELMYDRLVPFLADGESGESLKMRLVGHGGAATVTLSETDAGGYFNFTTHEAGIRTIAELIGAGKELQVQVVVPDEDKRRFVARVPLPPKRLPLLVISDVDDTVRIAEVTNRPRMIERVFLRRYEAVPGMSSVYIQLADRGAHLQFVSGSPWQIGPVIEAFLSESKFPPAVLHCRHIGWDFWNSDPLHTKDFKIETIESLLKQFAGCQVLLIGDDGEHDPEVYSEICRTHPDRVAGVWIRRVRDMWDATRLAEPARLLGRERAVAFKDSTELKQVLEKIEIAR